ncbi:DUF2975 domain-containing protein [Winogradskyella ouciana]|uniref:DUF2975 domain-containing protein n=1 Tax=Winogradskyella ouciana TaxID=2608631 RepID=UPI003D2DB4CC
MKKGTTLVNILYWFSKISFYLLIILLIIAISFEAFTKDGKLGQFSSGVHHSVGYQVPVSLKVHPQKPMYNSLLFELKNKSTNAMGQKYSSGVSHYAKPLTKEDSLNFRTIVSIHNRDMEDNYELTSQVFKGDGYVNVKPKKLLDKIILLIKTYLGFVLLIVIFFFLKNIFKALKSNFEFSQKLYKSIQILGIILIVQVLLVTICNYIVGSQLSMVGIRPLDYKLNYVTLSMNPRLDFDFMIFFVGISLLVLSTLLKSGNELKQENDLTI